MNFLVICLHSLDMRDFHSQLRDTHFIDQIKDKSIYIPMGRGQTHHHGDSLVPDLTGNWSARQSNSHLDQQGFYPPTKFRLSKTILEYMKEAGYDVFSLIDVDTKKRSIVDNDTGSHAVQNSIRDNWLKDEPERIKQFNPPSCGINLSETLNEIKKSNKFYAHIVLRNTHRPWGDPIGLCSIFGKKAKWEAKWRKFLGHDLGWPFDGHFARRASLEHPDQFASIRRAGLSRANKQIEQIYCALKDIPNLTILIYSNHGEVFDHFRYIHPYQSYEINCTRKNLRMIQSTTHGNFPYETVYANTQMWQIPNYSPKVMKGTGRCVDICPTILKLAGITPDNKLDGESMLEYFKGGEFPKRDRYAEAPLHGGALSMVRKDGYKLISVTNNALPGSKPHSICASFLDHKLAVFDLLTDPYEYVNLINTEQGQEVLSWAIETHKKIVFPENI